MQPLNKVALQSGLCAPGVINAILAGGAGGVTNPTMRLCVLGQTGAMKDKWQMPACPKTG